MMPQHPVPQQQLGPGGSGPVGVQGLSHGGRMPVSSQSMMNMQPQPGQMGMQHIIRVTTCKTLKYALNLDY